MKNPFKRLIKMANPAAGEPLKKVLVIEDEVILLDVLRDRLQGEGWGVKTVENGEDAIEVLWKEHFDLVLLDLLLPKKSGFEVLEMMKDDAELKTIPVIVLSNLGSDEDIKRAINLGAVDYFVKTQHPIAEVLEKIRKYK